MIAIKTLKIILTEDYICLYENCLVKQKLNNLFLNGYLIDSQKFINTVNKFLKQNKLNNGILMNNLYIYTHFINNKTLKEIAKIFKELSFKSVIVNNNFQIKIENSELNIYINSRSTIFLIKKYNKKTLKYISHNILLKEKDYLDFLIKYIKYLNKYFKIKKIKLLSEKNNKKYSHYVENKTHIKTYYVQ